MIVSKELMRFIKDRKKRIYKNWQLYLLMFPALAYFIIFCFVPIYGIQIAFKDFSPVLGINGSPWVGLEHFETFFQSIFFKRVFFNTIGLGAYMMSSIWTPIVLALMINEIKNKAFIKVVQNISYAPYFIPIIVSVGLLYLFLSPETGVINKVIGVLGVKPIDFMGDPTWFKTVYVVSNIWQNVGWASIIYIAALSGVDQQLVESAGLDGATKLQKIWHISIPTILPTIVIMILLNLGNITTTDFQKVFAMQNALNMDSSDVIATYVYRKGLIDLNYSLATAVGFFNALLTMAILMASNKIAKRTTESSLW